MLAGSLQILGVPMGSVNDQHEDPIFHDESNTGRMIATIAERNKKHRIWGWKLPNTIYYYHQLADHLRNPVFIAIYRNPFDIFMSAAEKLGKALDDPNFNAPIYHYARMQQVIHKHANVPAHLLSYERACAAPEVFIRELAALLPTPASAKVIDEAIAFVDAGKGYSALRTRPLERISSLFSGR